LARWIAEASEDSEKIENVTVDVADDDEVLVQTDYGGIFLEKSGGTAAQALDERKRDNREGKTVSLVCVGVDADFDHLDIELEDLNERGILHA
jgi:hypothetical protein